MPTPKKGAVYVANEDFMADLPSGTYVIRKGQTVREGHPLLENAPHLYSPAADTVDFEWEEAPPTSSTRGVEQATAAPGEKRGETSRSSEKRS